MFDGNAESSKLEPKSSVRCLHTPRFLMHTVLLFLVAFIILQNVLSVLHSQPRRSEMLIQEFIWQHSKYSHDDKVMVSKQTLLEPSLIFVLIVLNCFLTLFSQEIYVIKHSCKISENRKLFCRHYSAHCGKRGIKHCVLWLKNNQLRVVTETPQMWLLYSTVALSCNNCQPILHKLPVNLAKISLASSWLKWCAVN